MHIQLTKTQIPVILSKAKELQFIGQAAVGKTSAGLAKIMIWLQENNRTGFFVVYNRYSTKYVERLILSVWSSLGIYRHTDKSFNLVNGSTLFLVWADQLNHEHLGGAGRGSFVFDTEVSDDQYAFSLSKCDKSGFLLQLSDGAKNCLIEKTDLDSTNPYLKDLT